MNSNVKHLASHALLQNDILLSAQVVIIQACFNVALGCLVYKIVIQPSLTAKEKARDENESVGYPAQFLFVYGFAIPIIAMEPLHLIDFLDVRNVGLRMAILGTPIVNSLRMAEGEHLMRATSESNYIDEIYKCNRLKCIEYIHFLSIAWILPSRCEEEPIELRHLLFLHL